ncbi:MAG TPA: restriction endonuclease [Terriglobales bacterium]|nr:restriction endonuclease [Terriglobales bacterium]
MKRGPALVSKILIAEFEVTAQPRPLVELISETCLGQGWVTTMAEARETAERWLPQVTSSMQREYSELSKTGRFVPFAFNSSSPTYVQGFAFVEPRDGEEVRAAKQGRAQFKSYAAALEQLTPTEFESLCTGVLAIIGVDEPILTPRSADEGIDFYGRLRLEKHIFTDKPLPGLQRQLGVWLIGQAKHYTKGQVSTPEVRDLVGAVNLAKGHAFGSGEDDKYKNLAVRVCDPVFYLFFTTGRLSANSWTLLERSGVIGMDGQMLSAFLADHAVGVADGRFDEPSFREWLGRKGIPRV